MWRGVKRRTRHCYECRFWGKEIFVDSGKDEGGEGCLLRLFILVAFFKFIEQVLSIQTRHHVSEAVQLRRYYHPPRERCPTSLGPPYRHPIPHPISNVHDTLCNPNGYDVVSFPASRFSGSGGSGGKGLFRFGGGRWG